MQVQYIDTTKNQIEALQELSLDQPFQMLNLLKFKPTVEGTERTGEEQYKMYMEAATPFFQKSNARILFFGKMQLTLIGPENEWDKILIVEYASKEDFIRMVTADAYPADLRRSALEDARLILCTA